MLHVRTRPAVAAVLASLMLAACSGVSEPASNEPTPTVSPTATPSQGPASPSAEPSVEPTPAPTAGEEWEWLAGYAQYGPIARVEEDGLRVRLSAGTDAEVMVTLPAGTELLVWSGPVSADGRDWYNVGFHGIESEVTPGGIGTGWVAGEFISIADATCPGQLDASVLASMTDAALDACVDDVPVLSGQVDTCWEGPYSPFTYEPLWAYFSCTHLLTDGVAPFEIHFPPDYDGVEPERGDFVEVTGHFGFDTGEYGECTVESTVPELEDQLDVETQAWANRCQNRFIVEEVTITGHEDLPPR